MEKLKNAWHEFSMGILESDLVKAGVDILTKFLEIINKATSAFDGVGGSITKILTVLTVFKMGKTVFDKLRDPMVKFFSDIVKEAGLAGEKAGEAAQEGLKKSKNKKSSSNTKTPTKAEPLKKDKNGRYHKKDGSFANQDEIDAFEESKKGGLVTNLLKLGKNSQEER
jgi:hypothetical protein